MSNTNAYLYATLFMSMLETNSKNCLEIYKNIDLSFGDKLWFLEGVSSVVCSNGTMTREISDNIHLIYDNLLSTYKNKRVEIIESYNIFKEKINSNKLDSTYKLIYEDIIQREFEIYDKRLSILYEDAARDFYFLHYDELMDDIAFDYEVINYLVHPLMTLDNNICADERFLKSLKYVVNLNSKQLDYEMFIKIKATLDYRETLINEGFVKNTKMKHEHKKIVKRLGRMYEK